MFADLHDELRAVARDLLKSPAPDWSLLAASGWTGLEVPESLGGAGATFAETAVIVREMGRAVARSPYLGAAVLGVGTLLLLEPGPERDELLRQAAMGEVVPVAAVSAAATLPVNPAIFVLDAAQATHLLLLTWDKDGQPVVVPRPVGATWIRVTPEPVVDETRRVSTVTAEPVALAQAPGLRFAGDPALAVTRLLDRAAVAIACDSLGLMEAMLDATVAYARVRQQFGRPIGSFQAVQHACADMQVQVSVCRELVSSAVSAMAAGSEDAWVAAAMAKSHVTSAAVSVAGKAMQLHGGIGYTWESGIHAYLKRATLNRSLFGSPAQHRRRLATRYSAPAGR
jgi:alkylation response protein AidB-like acyl-CoA dehydrogenase